MFKEDLQAAIWDDSKHVFLLTAANIEFEDLQAAISEFEDLQAAIQEQ